MWRLLSIFVLLASAWAQLATMEQIPTPIQAKVANGGSLAYPNNITSGNILIVTWHSQNQTTAPSLPTDTLTSTWTLQVSQGAAGNVAYGYTWTATAPSSGADTVTVSAAGTTSQGMQVQEWKNVTETVDASVTANNNCSSNSLTVPNVTTVKYRDLVLDIVVSHGSESLGESNSSAYAQIENGNTDNIMTQYLIPTSNPGSLTGPTLNCVNGRNASEGVMALRSTASLTVSTPTIADPIVNQSYNFQMGATGGTGTNTWTTTAGTLPAGLSLSSGGNISGTPTASNANTITFKVTDGASATATANLTITVGASANTVANLQTHLQSSANTTNTFSSNVTSGSMILVIGIHAQNNGQVFPKVTDTRSTVFSPLPGAGECMADTGRQCHSAWWGFAPSGGADTITFTPGLSAGSEISEWSNVQQVFDTNVLSITYSTGGGATITSTAITAPVSETLYAVAGIGTSSGTVAVSSPFTEGNSNINTASTLSATGSDIGAAAGSQTVSFAVTGNTSNNWEIMLWGFRPTRNGIASSGLVPRKPVMF